MKQNFFLAAAILCIAAFSSCYPSLYFSDRVQTTAFTDKNQFLINGSLKPQIIPKDSSTEQGSSASYSVDAAYSFAENWAITGYYGNVHNRRVREDQQSLSYGNRLGGLHNGKRYELGITYFKTFGRSGIMELSAGFSQGYLDRTSKFTPKYNFNTRYNIYYGQAAYSFKFDYVVMSLGGKIWIQNYYKFDALPEVRSRYNSPQQGIDITRYPFLMTNLFYNAEFGYKFIKFNTQMGMPFQLNGKNITGFPFYVTFGMVFRLEKDIFKSTNTTSNNEKL